MITTAKLINISIISRSYLILYVYVCCEHLKSTLSKFQIHNTLLLTTVVARGWSLDEMERWYNVSVVQDD